jgi:hypothetical protein
MFKAMAAAVAVAAAGSVAWGATQGVSVGEIIRGVEHLTVGKDEHGNWSIRIDDPGDEVGFVKAMHDDVAFNQFNAAEMLQLGHKTCGWLRDGSGPNDIITWMDQKPGMARVSPVLLHKVELDLITNSQIYLCPDTLHNGTVSTTTAPPAPTGPTTMVATTAPPYPTPGWAWPPSDMNAYCRDHPNDWGECGTSGPSTPSSTPTYPTPGPCPYPGAAAHGCVSPTRLSS